jgi:hypothetical protein
MKHYEVALTNGNILGHDETILSFRATRDGWTTLFNSDETALYTIPSCNILWIHLTDTPAEKADPVRPLNTIDDWPTLCEFPDAEPCGYGILKWHGDEYKVYMGNVEAYELRCVGQVMTPKMYGDDRGLNRTMKHKFILIEV